MEWNPVNGLDSFGWYVAPRRLAYSCLVVCLLNQRYIRATFKCLLLTIIDTSLTMEAVCN